jgi:fumarate reductase subunit D
LFGAGGTITALLAPVLIVTIGFLVPAEQVEFDRLHAIITNPVARLALTATTTLTFFHGAHRVRHTLIQIGLRKLSRPVALMCYMFAVVGSVWAGRIAFS